eukprot:1616191-Pleurochrysis_carterae.AAC.4
MRVTGPLFQVFKRERLFFALTCCSLAFSATCRSYLTPLGNDINGIGVEPNVASTCASALAAATCVSQAVTTLAT